MKLLAGYYRMMKTSPIMAALIAVLAFGGVTHAAQAFGDERSPQPLEEIPAQLVRGDVVTQTVILPDGRKLDFIQFFPSANKEHVCLGNLTRHRSLDNYTELGELDCFPVKTNPTPTMY